MMSLYTIEINEEAIQKQISAILNTIMNHEIDSKYSESGREIARSIKELVYSRKDEIIEKVVDRASKEIVRKALPKLIERFDSE